MTREQAGMMGQERFYRASMEASGLVSFGVTVEHTDLHVSADEDHTDRVRTKVEDLRSQIKGYIEQDPRFARSLEPVEVSDDAPEIVKRMAMACGSVGIGPMASVAGAIAEYVGRDLLEVSDEVIVENGGDIFMATNRLRTVGIYAGDSVLSNRIGIEVDPFLGPLGICTSAGTVGHSLSLGCADAVAVVASSALLADAAATALGNLVKDDDFDAALTRARGIPGLTGVIIVKREKMGVWGSINLIPIE